MTESASPRPARTEDEAALAALARAAYAPYVPRLGREPPAMRPDFARRIAEAAVWVFDGPDGVDGYVIALRQGDALLVENVAVAPERQGRGIGRRLLAFAEDLALRRGLRATRLYTNLVMTENQALYARLGWREIGRRPLGDMTLIDYEKP